MIARRTVLSAMLLSAMFGATASAQTYPDRVIKFVVPYSPGGPVDVMARLLATPLSSILGQAVIVENRAGAAGAIGAKAVATAAPDGYTLLFGNISSLVVVPAVMRNRDYDPAKAFVPIAKTSQNVEVLIVHPKFAAKSVQELIEYAKANPGRLNFGSSGIGNTTHLAAELFKLRTGIDIVHVPYKGAFDVVTAVIGGQVHMFFGDIGGVLPLIHEGRVRALAVSSEARVPEAPDVPTMMESGVPDYTVLTYTGVVAPAGTPAPIVDKLNAAINKSLQTPEVVATLAKLGADGRPETPEAFGTFLAKEREKWNEVVQRAGLKIE